MKKRAYVIVKYRSNAFRMSYPVMHEVFMDRAKAKARCKELNAEAQSNVYEVNSVPLVGVE